MRDYRSHRKKGVLEQCEVSRKKALPVALDRCAITGKRALKGYLVTSSSSNARLLESIAMRSSAGRFCAPSEARACTWSGRKVHPDDLRKCELTGLPIHFQFLTSTSPPRLVPLLEILEGVRRNSEEKDKWQEIADKLSAANKGGRYSLQAAILSPDRKRLATCSELKAMLGIRVYQVGALYDFSTNSIVGKISTGRRSRESWTSHDRKKRAGGPNGHQYFANRAGVRSELAGGSIFFPLLFGRPPIWG